MMNAARRHATMAIRSARACVAVRRATKPAANGTAKLVSLSVKRIRLVEHQLFDADLLAQLSIRQTPLQQDALRPRAARIAIANCVGRRVA